MRKISFKVRNIGSEKYLSYILNDDCEFDEELLDYLRRTVFLNSLISFTKRMMRTIILHIILQAGQRLTHSFRIW